MYWNFHGQFAKVDKSAAVSKVRTKWIVFRPPVLLQGQIMRISNRIIRSRKIAFPDRLTKYFSLNTLRTGDGDLRFYIKTVQDG